MEIIILFSPLSCKTLARGQSQTLTAASDVWAQGAGGRSDVWAQGAGGRRTLCFILPNSKDQRSANTSCQGPVGTICPKYPVSPWLARPNHTPYINKGAKSWWTFFVDNVLFWFWMCWNQQWLPQTAQLWVCSKGDEDGRHTHRKAGYFQCTLLTSVLQPGEGFAVSLRLEHWDPRE